MYSPASVNQPIEALHGPTQGPGEDDHGHPQEEERVHDLKMRGERICDQNTVHTLQTIYKTSPPAPCWADGCFHKYYM